MQSQQQTHLMHLKSVESTGYYGTSSVEAYDDYNRDCNDDLKQPLSNLSQQQPSVNQPQPQTSQLSKLMSFALHLPIPEGDEYQHERNQRFVILYGFGSKK
jgi:hypothetical protein